MKRKFTRTASLFLALISLMSMGAVTGCQKKPSDENTTLVPSGLKLNLLSEPIGITKDRLSFSWVMNDSGKNEKQTAYHLIVTGADGVTSVYDSGWVETSQSAGVVPEGLSEKLSDNTLYAWRVATKNSEGKESALSELQFFTTEVGSAWASTEGIWAEAETEAVEYSDDWTDYVMDVTFRITNSAVGFIFRGSEKDFYMWQFKFNNGKVGLYPHVFKNGSFVGGSQIAEVKIPDELAFAAGDTVNARIVCEGNTAVTSLKKDGEYVQIDSRDLSAYGLKEGVVGVRTGSSEEGVVSSMKVTTVSGDPLYFSDFGTSNPFAKCSTENGELKVQRGLSTGCLLDREVLNAKTGNGSSKSGNAFVFLRHEFEVSEEKLNKTVRAVASVTASSPEPARQYVFNLSVNGKQVGVGPARLTSTPKKDAALPYESYDIVDLLKAGKNCVSAINYTTKDKLFLCQITLFYADGTSEIIVNSARDAEKWKSMEGDRVFGMNNSTGTNYYTAHANNIDASLYPYGFSEVGFDDSAWRTAVKGAKLDDGQKLVPAGTDPVTRFETDPTKNKVTKPEDGKYLIDLGEEIVGGIRVTLDLPEETTLTVKYAETLLEDGTVCVPLISGNNYTETWKSIKGKNVFETIEMLCYRYIEISGCPVEVKPADVVGLEIHTAPAPSGNFSSDSELLNDLFALTKNTIDRTTQGLMVDAQSRERCAYEGDLLINLYSAYAVSSDYSVGRATAEYLLTHRTWPAEYILYATMAVELDYRVNGDLRTAEQYYNILKNHRFNGYTDKSTGLIRHENTATSTTDAILVDWPLSERDGYEMKVAYNTVLNAVSVRGELALAVLADAIGKTGDAETYRKEAEALKAAMIEKLWDEEKGAFADGMNADGTRSAHYSQHATAYALSCGIYTDKAMAAKMADFIAAQGEIRMSVFGTFFLLDGLYSSGHGDIANRLLLSEDTDEGARTFAYMLRVLDATLTTEAWNEKNKNNMTYCHPWGSAPGFAAVNGILGINPTSAGFETFDVSLSTSGLNNISYTLPTVKGDISVSWKLNGNTQETSLVFPANTVGRVSVPAAESAKVTLDGKKAEAVYENGAFVLTIGSGEHILTVG